MRPEPTPSTGHVNLSENNPRSAGELSRRRVLQAAAVAPLTSGALDHFTHRVGEPKSEPGWWEGEIKTGEHGDLTDLIADKTINYIRDYSSRKQPFLLSVHFNAPHWLWEVPEDESAAFKGGLGKSR